MRARHSTGSLMDPMHAPTVRSLIFLNVRLRFFSTFIFSFSFLCISQIIPVSSPTPWPFLVLWEEEFGSHAFDGTIQRSDEQRRAVDGDWERARWRRSRARRRRSLARRQRNSGVVIWSFQSHSFSFFFFFSFLFIALWLVFFIVLNAEYWQNHVWFMWVECTRTMGKNRGRVALIG